MKFLKLTLSDGKHFSDPYGITELEEGIKPPSVSHAVELLSTHKQPDKLTLLASTSSKYLAITPQFPIHRTPKLVILLYILKHPSLAKPDGDDDLPDVK